MDPTSGLRFADPKRFDPAKWKQKVCVLWADNRCLRGSRCVFAHGARELRARTKRTTRPLPTLARRAKSRSCSVKAPDSSDSEYQSSGSEVKGSNAKVKGNNCEVRDSNSEAKDSCSEIQGSDLEDKGSDSDDTGSVKEPKWTYFKAFEFGITKKVEIYIGEMEDARFIDTLRELNITTAVRCEYSRTAPWTLGISALREELFELRPCFCGMRGGLERTHAKFINLVDGKGNILFWCCSGGVMAGTVAAMFALSMWPWEAPESLMAKIMMKDRECKISAISLWHKHFMHSVFFVKHHFLWTMRNFTDFFVKEFDVTAGLSDMEQWRRYICERHRHAKS